MDIALGITCITTIVICAVYTKYLKKELFFKREFFNETVNNSNMIVVVWTLDGTITYVNKYAERKTGFCADELLRRNWFDIFVHQDELPVMKKDIERFINQKISANYMRPLKCKSGKYIDVIWNSSIIYNSDNSCFAVSLGVDISEYVKASEAFAKLSNYHHITNLPNQALFTKDVKNVLSLRDGQMDKAAVMLIDVDNFVHLNNAYGRKFCDKLLKNIGEVLKTCFNNNEIISHYEGDCFAVFLPELKDKEDAVALAGRILEIFHMPWHFGRRECYSTVSIGISIYPDDGGGAEILIKNADSALYLAKKNGRDRCQLYTKAIDIQLTNNLNIEYNLRRAIEKEEFVVYYQPQINIGTGEIVALEALIRWNHPADGIITPSAFIPVAEETGLIDAIDDWVLKTACQQVSALNTMFDTNIMLAVNVSSRQFQNLDFANEVFHVIKSTQFDPRLLEIEVTEEAAIKDINSTIRLLRELENSNINIALDDFCTGYSSLCYLELLPINKIKIDKSFVDGMIDNYKKESIVESLIGLAHKLGICVVAEGVEDNMQLCALKKKNCDIVQGYLFSKPLPFDDIVQYITAYSDSERLSCQNQ